MNKTIYTQDHKKLVDKLKQARIEAKFDQKKVAGLLGVTQSYISKVESGQRKIDVIQLSNFAKIYRKSLNYFIR